MTETATLEELTKTVEQLSDRIDSLEDENERLAEENARLKQRVADLEEQPTIEMADTTQIDDLIIGDVPVGNVITAKASKSDVEWCEGEIEDLETNLEASNPTPEGGKTTVQQHETSLEQVAAMPEHMVDDQLSPNQQRARHIALHIADYATKTNGGRILRAGDLRTVLQARFDTSHSETVARVREFLNRLGGDQVEVKEPQTSCFKKVEEKKGKGKMIVVDEQLAYNLHQINQQQDHDVVTSAEA